MKVQKQITMDIDVEVDVSLDEVVLALAGEMEEPDAVRSVVRGINHVLLFLRAIPDSLLDDMSRGQREVVQEVLMEQAKRFASRDGNGSATLVAGQ